MSRKRARFKKDSVEELDSKEKHTEKEQVKEEYDAFEFMKNKKTAAVAGVFFLLGMAIMYAVVPGQTGMVVSEGLPMNADDIAENGVSFLNDYFVDGGGVSFVSVEEGGELMIVKTSYNGNEIPVHMTKDGQYIILGGVGAVDMAEFSEQAGDTADAPQPAQGTDVPKADVPVVNAFIMSYCPYGLQMQKALIPVMELLGDKADINVNFVNYIMHGKKEIDDNNNQYCIQRDQPELLTGYLRCFVEKGNHDTCAAEAGVDMSMLSSCISEIDAEYRITELYEDQSTWSGGRYPLYMVDDELNKLYGVRGSPTVVINGQTVSVQRSSEAVKQAVCDAFNTPPEECSTVLNTAGEQPSFGAVGTGTQSAGAPAANCGV